MEPIKEIREIDEGYTAMNKLAKIEDVNTIFLGKFIVIVIPEV